MVDPLTIAKVAFTAISAISSLGQAEQQAQAIEAEASLRRDEAKAAAARAVSRAEQVRRQGRREQGERVGVFAERGITLEGSPTDVLADAAMADELAAQFEIFEGQQISRARLQEANIREREADATRTSGAIRAATILGEGAFLASSGGGGGGGSGGRAPINLGGRTASSGSRIRVPFT